MALRKPKADEARSLPSPGAPAEKPPGAQRRGVRRARPEPRAVRPPRWRAAGGDAPGDQRRPAGVRSVAAHEARRRPRRVRAGAGDGVRDPARRHARAPRSTPSSPSGSTSAWRASSSWSRSARRTASSSCSRPIRRRRAATPPRPPPARRSSGWPPTPRRSSRSSSRSGAPTPTSDVWSPRSRRPTARSSAPTRPTRSTSTTRRRSSSSSTASSSQALRDRASDIHVEPLDKDVRVRFRIDGQLVEAVKLPMSAHNPLVSRLKIMSGMNIVEKRAPAGRPVLDHRRRPPARRPRRQRRHGVRREGRHATARQEQVDGRPQRARHATRDLQHVLQDRARPVRHGDLRRPDRRRQDDDAVRHAAGDQLDRQERHHHRGPGRVRVPRHQPGADQRARRPHVRHGPEGPPAPGPRRDPRRRDPRRRHRPHRRAVGAHRPLRALVVARQRLAWPPCTACSTWASRPSSSPRPWSPWCRSACCGASATTARSSTRPTADELAVFQQHSGGA